MIAARSMPPAEMLPSLRAIMTGLLTYTLWRSTWVLQRMPSLQTAARQNAMHFFEQVDLRKPSNRIDT